VGYSALLRGVYLKRTFFCGMFYLCAVTPVFAIYTFRPTILKSFGLNDGNLSNIGYALISLLFLLGCLPALRIGETGGRRPLLLWSFALMVVPFLALGIAPQAPVGVIIFWFCLYAVASGGPNILEWSYPNELFPTDIRATAMGVVTAVSRIGAALGTFATLVLGTLRRWSNYVDYRRYDSNKDLLYPFGWRRKPKVAH
jgi:putative MFS transporter